MTIVSLGPDFAQRAVKQAVAMGADEGILLKDPAFEDSDTYATAYILAEAIKKLGAFDLILCGRQAADWDVGQVGVGVAELLEIPCVDRPEDRGVRRQRGDGRTPGRGWL